MHVFRAPIVAVLWGLRPIAAILLPTCYSHHLIDPLLTTTEDYHSHSNAIKNLCTDAVAIGNNGTLTRQVDNFTFRITPGEAPYDSRECESAFSIIIEQCSRSDSGFGGILREMTGSVYDITQTSLHGRAPRSRGGRAKRPKPQRISKPKAQHTRKKSKPKTEQQSKAKSKLDPKPKATLKAKHTSNAIPTKSTPVSSAIKTKPTKSCAQLYAKALTKTKSKALIGQRDIQATRAGFIGSRASLDKRASSAKSVTGCGMNFRSQTYPDKGSMPRNALWYGYKQPKVCSKFAFGASPGKPWPGSKPSDYHIEHVLEWNLVASFFEWVNEKNKKAGVDFENPNPNVKTRMNFCDYAKAIWPVAQLAVGSDAEKRTPLAHLAQAYPGEGNPTEFVYLHALINTPAKTQMWRYKSNEEAGIFDQVEKDKEISGGAIKVTPPTKPRKGRKGKQQAQAPAPPGKQFGDGRGSRTNQELDAEEIDAAKDALLDLKYLMGARIYMRDPKIAAIFTKQKDRLGDMLGSLDDALAKPENAYYSKTKGVTFRQWKPQNLKALWNDFMDESFQEATKRTNKDMNQYLQMFEEEWLHYSPPKGSQTDKFITLIKNVRQAWRTEKARRWSAP